MNVRNLESTHVKVIRKEAIYILFPGNGVNSPVMSRSFNTPYPRSARFSNFMGLLLMRQRGEAAKEWMIMAAEPRRGIQIHE